MQGRDVLWALGIHVEIGAGAAVEVAAVAKADIRRQMGCSELGGEGRDVSLSNGGRQDPHCARLYPSASTFGSSPVSFPSPSPLFLLFSATILSRRAKSTNTASRHGSRPMRDRLSPPPSTCGIGREEATETDERADWVLRLVQVRGHERGVGVGVHHSAWLWKAKTTSGSSGR
jgi:hypothetical protein